jgi:hypothetical protein
MLLKEGVRPSTPRTPLPRDAVVISVAFSAHKQLVTILFESQHWPDDGPQAIDSAPFHDDIWLRSEGGVHGSD